MTKMKLSGLVKSSFGCIVVSGGAYIFCSNLKR